MDFFEKYKKILLVVGFILLVILMGYAIYALFFQSSTPTKPGTEPTATTTSGVFPTTGTGSNIPIEPDKTGETQLPTEETPIEANEIAQGGLTKVKPLNEDSSLAPTLSGNGSDLQYYNTEEGKFYRIDKDGKASLMTEKVFHNVENVTWSPKKTEAILEYPDGANIIYDFANEKQITLPNHWKDFNYSPTGDQIIMKSIGVDSGNRWLAVANKDGSKVTPIEELGTKDETVYTEWSPNKQIISMFTEGIDFNRQEVYFVGLNGENFKSTIIEGRGFDPLWAPKGDQLLYSVYSSDNDMKPSLWIVGAEGDNIGANRHSLKVDTWASKCAFSSQTELYCAVPEELEAGAGIFPEMALNTKDRLFKINTATGLKQLVAVPDNAYNMSNVILSDNGYYLYFTDATTGHIHQLKLK